MSTRSHQRCIDAGEHICQQPSGRTCVEDGCEKTAGTLWGPLWCPEHDQERLDRVSRQMNDIAATLQCCRVLQRAITPLIKER